MTGNIARFEDSGKARALSSFTGEFLVRCPKCGAAAIIRGTRLTCTSCHASIEAKDAPARASALIGNFQTSAGVKNWFGNVKPVLELKGGTPLRYTCSSCGKDLAAPATRSNAANLPRDITLTCDGCGRENSFTPVWHPAYSSHDARDPAFGCELFLQKTLRDGTLFVFNAKHAEALLEYISAGLREFKADQGRHSYFTNLPTWIKAAKNRDTIVKTLEGFIEEMNSIT
ncbi:hypothetical protein [Kordiimonas aestuarii]|uniref:hypothetical protein n=1 Tax=Kordiimonas aestuarii TaxID=1005925 RepID=UPI0021D0019E|nr:hypothetical protein [Kordiimonas aestuarii]